MLRSIILSLIFMFIVVSLRAQHEERDSAFLYKKIEAFSQQRKVTDFIYKSIFRPVTPTPVPVPGKKKSRTAPPVPKSHKSFNGKVIRNIYIITYDPFGFDVKDTTISPKDFLPKAGNALHVKTWPLKIKNLMIVKKYDTFDSLRVKESERLIRSQTYIRDVFISPVLKNDSVDLYVRVYDVWSILITGDATPSGFKIDLKDKNILGTGHQFQNTFKQNYITGKNSYLSNYYIPSIYNTYITSTIHYNIDEDKNYLKSISLDRPFYSVFTSWAGGISLQQQLNRAIISNIDSTQFKQTYKSNTEDYWIGKSWQLFRGQSEEQRSTNIIASARYLKVHFTERAQETLDTMHTHANQDFYLVGVGLSRRQYKQDNYIFRYGNTEDVPVGRAYSIVTGYQVRDRIPRYYLGSRVYMANYHQWGYFNLYFEYGTFINKTKFEEGVFATGINYFSKIFKIGRWQIRQFIKPQFILGHDRTLYDNLSLNNESGIRGFTSTGLKGTQKLIFTFQLQSYAPWNIIGFRFGPYIVCSFGMLGTEKSGFKSSPLYSGFGIGLLIKNEYLILNTFQLSLVYYPVIPGYKNSVFKVNPVKTTDFGFQGFDISKPTPVSYQ